MIFWNLFCLLSRYLIRIGCLCFPCFTSVPCVTFACFDPAFLVIRRAKGNYITTPWRPDALNPSFVDKSIGYARYSFMSFYLVEYCIQVQGMLFSWRGRCAKEMEPYAFHTFVELTAETKSDVQSSKKEALCPVTSGCL
jgi:hypothetical protein